MTPQPDNGPVVKAIVGMTGTGKTQKAITLTKTWDRILFYDTLGHDYDEGVTFTRIDHLGHFWQRVYDKRFRIIYRPKDPQADFKEICQQVYDVGDMAFVVEEAQLFCKQGKCLDGEFTQLIASSRHQNVDLICCTQAPKQFADFLRSQAHEWFVFMTKEPQHTKYLRDRFGGMVNAFEIAGLKRFQYIHFRDYGENGVPDVHLCMDDLTTGTTDARKLQSPIQPAGPSPDTDQHQQTGSAMGMRPADGDKNLQGTPDPRDQAKAERADILPGQ